MYFPAAFSEALAPVSVAMVINLGGNPKNVYEWW